MSTAGTGTGSGTVAGTVAAMWPGLGGIGIGPKRGWGEEACEVAKGGGGSKGVDGLVMGEEPELASPTEPERAVLGRNLEPS